MMGASGFVSNSSPHRYARPCAALYGGGAGAGKRSAEGNPKGEINKWWWPIIRAANIKAESRRASAHIP